MPSYKHQKWQEWRAHKAPSSGWKNSHSNEDPPIKSQTSERIPVPSPSRDKLSHHQRKWRRRWSSRTNSHLKTLTTIWTMTSSRIFQKSMCISWYRGQQDRISPRRAGRSIPTTMWSPRSRYHQSRLSRWLPRIRRRLSRWSRRHQLYRNSRRNSKRKDSMVELTSVLLWL